MYNLESENYFTLPFNLHRYYNRKKLGRITGTSVTNEIVNIIQLIINKALYFFPRQTSFNFLFALTAAAYHANNVSYDHFSVCTTKN